MPSSHAQLHPLPPSPSPSPILTQALRHLRPHLPVSLPLYRRLQSHAHFTSTSCLITNLPLYSTPLPSGKTAWMMAFVDRGRAPETEVWCFGSWESWGDGESEGQEGKMTEGVREVVRAVVEKVKGLDGPESLSAKNGDAADGNVMLWGAVHERTARVFQDWGLLTRGLEPNWMFVFDLDALPATRDLPKGLHWGELKQEHFDLVRSRTSIQRRDRTLGAVPNLAIFEQGSSTPISWVFLGLDASLTSLHVEKEWRGRGLAKAITTKIFKEKMDGFWQDGVKEIAHGYVIVGNKESEGMCRSLGGTSGWQTFWLRVDLGQV